jgi:hypothetical protein
MTVKLLDKMNSQEMQEGTIFKSNPSKDPADLTPMIKPYMSMNQALWADRRFSINGPNIASSSKFFRNNTIKIGTSQKELSFKEKFDPVAVKNKLWLSNDKNRH